MFDVFGWLQRELAYAEKVYRRAQRDDVVSQERWPVYHLW